MDTDRKKNITILGILCLSGSLLYVLGGKLKLLACPFRAVTGYPCPGCGGVRSATALLDGNISEAFRYNPLSPFVVLFLAISVIWLFYDIVKGKKSYLKIFSYKWSLTATVIVLSLIIINWIWLIFKMV